MGKSAGPRSLHGCGRHRRPPAKVSDRFAPYDIRPPSVGVHALGVDRGHPRRVDERATSRGNCRTSVRDNDHPLAPERSSGRQRAQGLGALGLGSGDTARPIDRAAVSVCSKANLWLAFEGFTRAMTAVICGKAVCSSSSRLALSSVCMRVKPVIFPPGREEAGRESPLYRVHHCHGDDRNVPLGSTALAAGAPSTTMTSTGRPTSSAASGGPRERCLGPTENSRMILRPST